MALKAKTIAEAFVEILQQTKSPRTGKKPMSRVELSKILGITPSNVSRISNPKINQRPRDQVLRKLADEFSHLTTFEELVALRAASPEPTLTSSGRAGSAKKTDSSSRSKKSPAVGAESTERGTVSKGPQRPVSGDKRGQAARPRRRRPAGALPSSPELSSDPVGPPPEHSSPTPPTTPPEKPHTEGGQKVRDSRPIGELVPTRQTEPRGPTVLGELPGRRTSIVTPRGHRAPPPPVGFKRQVTSDSPAVAPAQRAPAMDEGGGTPLTTPPSAPTPPTPETAPMQVPIGVPGAYRPQRPTSLADAHLVTISLFANNLRTGDNSEVVSLDTRYTVAVSLALGELDRVAGDDAFGADTQAAAAALINDLWRISARARHGDRDEIRPLGTSEEERERLKAYISAAPERTQAYRRLIKSLPSILFPNGYTDMDLDDIRTVLLRGFTLGARR